MKLHLFFIYFISEGRICSTFLTFFRFAAAAVFLNIFLFFVFMADENNLLRLLHWTPTQYYHTSNPKHHQDK